MSLLPQPRLNPHRLLKRELVWLMQNYCKHGHTYIEHQSCYFKEKPAEGPVIEKLGFFDIESTNLQATFGYVFSYCIKELDGPVISRIVTPREIRSHKFDCNIMKKLCSDIRKFDRIIT